MIDQEEQDSAAYLATPSMLDTRSVENEPDPPFKTQQEPEFATTPAPVGEGNFEKDMGIDVQVSLLDAILQELRQLNQNIRNNF
jgi:hypothetical protein